MSFCKDLTTRLIDFPEALIWRGHENRFQRPEYVAVTVSFDTAEQIKGQAVCFYDYDTVDENAMTHSQPLSAYSTVPYQMQLNGETVDQPILANAIQSGQTNLVNKILASFIRWFDDSY